MSFQKLVDVLLAGKNTIPCMKPTCFGVSEQSHLRSICGENGPSEGSLAQPSAYFHLPPLHSAHTTLDWASCKN